NRPEFRASTQRADSRRSPAEISTSRCRSRLGMRRSRGSAPGRAPMFSVSDRGTIPSRASGSDEGMVAMKVRAEALEAWVTSIFEAAGCSAPEGRRVARRLVESNLVGHDSHGVIRVPSYVQWLREGKVFAGRTIEVVSDRDAIAVVDGGYGLGQTI